MAVPEQEERRPRNVEVSDATWEHVRAFSEESGRSIKHIVEKALEWYVGQQCSCSACRPNRKKEVE